jgi:hypothetical protein
MVGRNHTQGLVPKSANHPKGWDAKPLACIQRALDMAAGLPGEHSTSAGLCLSHGPIDSYIDGGAVCKLFFLSLDL